jgi:hypothetical protein
MVDYIVILYPCENLAKYDHIKAELINQNTPYTLEDLCTSHSASRAELWASIGFAYSYSTHPYWETEHKDSRGWFDDWKHEYKLTIGRQYDLNSIMRYHSYRNHKPNVEVQVPLTVMNLPLMKWRNGGPEFVPPQQVTAANAELIPVNYDGGRRPRTWNRWRSCTCREGEMGECEEDLGVNKIAFSWGIVGRE